MPTLRPSGNIEAWEEILKVQCATRGSQEARTAMNQCDVCRTRSIRVRNCSGSARWYCMKEMAFPLSASNRRPEGIT